MASGEYVAWVAVSDESPPAIVAGAGLRIDQILPRPGQRGIERVNLHASDDGRPVYEQAGFVPTNEMRYTITARPSPGDR